MTLKKYLSLMFVLTLISWSVFLFVTAMVDPTSTNWVGFVLFYLSFFISLSGSIALFGFLVRFVALQKELAFNLVKISFRQSFLFSLFIVILLILKAHNLFNWPNLFLLVIMFTIWELFFISYQKNYKS